MPRNLFTALKVITTLVCILLFLALMKEAWNKFDRKTTNTGSRIRFWKNKNKTLPCMTICPMPGFKKKGFFYSEKLLKENSFSLEEIFSPNTSSLFKNSSTFSIKYTTSQQLGQCITVCYMIPFPPKLSPLIFGINQNLDLKVFIHQKNTDFWMTGFKEFPIDDPSSVFIESNNSKGFHGANLNVAEVETTYLSLDEKECKPPSEDKYRDFDEFIDCSKEILWKKLPPEIDCTVIDMKHIIPKNSTMKECANDTTAESVYFNYGHYLTVFAMNPAGFGCPVPCMQTIYKLTLEYVHYNNLKLPAQYSHLDNYFVFRQQFSTLDVEERIENLDYDLASLLVSAGGNLGLFIGFSCLSVVFEIINFLHSFYK